VTITSSELDAFVPESLVLDALESDVSELDVFSLVVHPDNATIT